MPSTARSSSGTSGTSNANCAGRPAADPAPAAFGERVALAPEPLFEEHIGEAQVLLEVARQTGPVSLGARRSGRPGGGPRRPSSAGSCRVRRRAPTGAGCRRSACAGPAADPRSAAASRAPRRGARAGGPTRSSRDPYRRGTRPQWPTDNVTCRPASNSSSANWTPVWPVPTTSTSPGGSASGLRVVVGVDLRYRRTETGPGDARHVERPGGTDDPTAPIVPADVSTLKRWASARVIERHAPDLGLEDDRGVDHLRVSAARATISSRVMNPSGSPAAYG